MNFNGALEKQIVGTFYDDLVKYYGLYGFIKYKIKALKQKPLHITSCEDFWSLILKEQFVRDYDRDRKVLSGQLLTFSSSFYLSEWAPKVPGKIWTKSGKELLTEAYNHQMQDTDWPWKRKFEVVFDESGKRKAMEAGFGSVRINPSNNPTDAFMYMSMTTMDDWDIDSGIPVIAPKAVFEEYRRKSVDNGAVEIGKLEGILVIDLDLPVKEIISKAIGAQIDQKSIDLLTKQTFLPRCYVYIPSILGADFKYNNSHPACTGWTMYKKKIHEDWKKNYNQKADVEFGLTYSPFYPTDKNSVVEAVEFMKAYAEYNNGSEIITDFDGMEPKFESRLRITDNPEKTQVVEFKGVIEEINGWVKSVNF